MCTTRRFLGVLMICGRVASVAAQEASTTGLTIQSDLPTETAASSADSPASTPQWPVAEASTPVAYLQASDASGQVVGQPEGAAPTPRHTGIMAMVQGLGHDIVNLPSRENLLWVDIGTGVSLAVHPADSHVNADLSGPTLHKVFEPGAILGQSYTLFGIAGTIYAVGRIKDQPKVSHTGMDLIRSVAIAELITESRLKYTVRRERPDHSDTFSFPSGHSADTMAFATALERHFDWRYAVPAVPVCFLRGHVQAATERALPERCHGWRSGRDHRRPDGHPPRTRELPGHRHGSSWWHGRHVCEKRDVKYSRLKGEGIRSHDFTNRPPNLALGALLTRCRLLSLEHPSRYDDSLWPST